jgi:HEPN domain-containing protein
MKIIPKPPYSLELVKELGELCIENANSFVEDAELLINVESYGHAMALSIFAIEETAKSCLCRLVIDGKMPLEKDWWGTFYSHQAKLSKSFELFTPLEWADAIADFILDAYNFLKGIPIVSEGVETLGSGQTFLENLRGLLQESSSSNKNILDLISEAYHKTRENLTQELDTRRKSGLYVGIDETRNTISPKNVTKSDAQRFLNLAKQRIKMIDELNIRG